MHFAIAIAVFVDVDVALVKPIYSILNACAECSAC
jgi:hypothetical protein